MVVAMRLQMRPAIHVSGLKDRGCYTVMELKVGDEKWRADLAR